MRELSRSLTDNSIEKNTIYQLVNQEVKKIADLNLCSITFECNHKSNDLAYTQKAILFRIVQEFLQNSMKHAQCKSITIQLNFNMDNVHLLIEDDGKGFDVSKINTSGIGLANMQKRTEMIGGTFALESSLNKGTQLTVILPIIE